MRILAILNINVVPVGDITAIQVQSCGFKKLWINGLTIVAYFFVPPCTMNFSEEKFNSQ